MITTTDGRKVTNPYALVWAGDIASEWVLTDEVGPGGVVTPGPTFTNDEWAKVVQYHNLTAAFAAADERACAATDDLVSAAMYPEAYSDDEILMAERAQARWQDECDRIEQAIWRLVNG